MSSKAIRGQKPRKYSKKGLKRYKTSKHTQINGLKLVFDATVEDSSLCMKTDIRRYRQGDSSIPSKELCEILEIAME